MISRVLCFLTSCVLAAALCATSMATDFHNLGNGNAVTALSLDGSIAAGTNPTEYFTWTASGGIVGIGGTPAGGGVGGQAKMSDNGTRISGTVLNPASGQFEMSYYDTTTSNWTNLGGIGSFCTGGPGDEASSGWGISNDGTSVVGLGWFEFCGPAHAIQWNESSGVTSDLGSTVVDRSSRANAANQDGSVVVGWQDRTDGFRQGAVWNNGVQTIITTSTGDPTSEASDVDASGNWVVGSGGFATGDQAWRWNASTGDLDLLGIDCPGCFFPSSFAAGISNDGSTVVGFSRGLSGPPIIGTVWTEATGLVRLNDLALSLGIDTGGLDLAQPLAISGDGKTIAGVGIPAGGFFPTDGFVITIPEPSSFMLLVLLGLTGLATRRHR